MTVIRKDKFTCHTFSPSLLKIRIQAYEMAQQVKVLTSKTESLNLIPGIHVVEGKNRLQQIVSDFCIPDK